MVRLITRIGLVSLLVIPPLIASPGRTLAQNFATYGGEQFFKIEWEPAERKGKPEVRGYLDNAWGEPAVNVRLRVESLDAAGSVIATTIGRIPDVVMPGTRAYFEVEIPAKAPSYRVSVLSYDWLERGGGTGGDNIMRR
ncbi:MAG TPA: hypothetical protein VGV13_22175 [Methylomirabilota bacterium]|jgi:hypothetical protein|nr:hypothetical protein [Methylomirabilota bacterium]